MDTIGILANRVATVQQVHKVIEPAYSSKKQSVAGVRIGVPRQHYFSVLDSEVARVTETSLQTLRDAGAELVESDIGFLSDFDDMILSFKQLIAHETVRLIPKYLEEQGAPVNFKELCDQSMSPMVRKIITTAKRVSDERYRECQQDSQDICRLFQNYFVTNKIEGFVVPTTILPALKRPTSPSVTVCGQEFPLFHVYVHNTVLQASAGVPSISLPSGLSSNGLPIGLELVAPRGMDSNLLNLAAGIEEVLPTMSQVPFKLHV
jgi:mandelamide amidase